MTVSPQNQVSANVLTLVETLWLCCKEFSHTAQSQPPQWGAPAALAGAASMPEVKTEAMDMDLRPKKVWTSVTRFFHFF